MLQRNNGNGQLKFPALHPVLGHIQAVLGFILNELVRERWGRMIAIATVGTFGRILNLLTFVAALKGFLVAINPEKFAATVEKAFASQGMTVSVSKMDLVLFVVAGLVVLNIMAFIVSRVRHWAISKLVRQFLADAVKNTDDLDVTYDDFLINRVAPSIDNVIRLIEVVMFSGLVCTFIAIISPKIALFLLPVLIVIPLAVLIAGRHRLKVADDKRRAISAYKEGFPKDTTNKMRVQKWIENEREDHIASTLDTRQEQLRPQQIGNLVMAAVFIALIVYVANTELGSFDLLSIPLPLIFIVLALRQMLGYAREFGTTLSKLLELRDGMHHVRANRGGDKE